MSIATRSLTAVLVLLVPLTSAAPGAEPASKTVEYSSPSVGRTLKYNIALPADYKSSGKRYPVLYLLHGYTSNYTAWNRLGAAKAAAAYPLIVVMPDVGNTWYVNWVESGEGQKNAWEDAIVKDLIDHVDSTYRTVARREGRAINGLSMGGYGALMLGLRHPEDMFCSIGSHSGAVAFARSASERLKKGEEFAKAKREHSAEPNPDIKIEGFSSQAERSPKGKVWKTAEQCDAHDPFKLVLGVPRERLPLIYIDCGTEDRLITSNQEFMKLLMDNKIPFTYAQSLGEHKAPYWQRMIGQSVAVQYYVIQRSMAGAVDAQVDGAKAAAR